MSIVVGVDGSDGSRQALRWAIEEAALRQVPLQAVATWQMPTYAYTGVAVLPPMEELGEATREVLAEAVAQETASLSGPSAQVQIEQVVVEGPAAGALIERSRHADLLVVGSRGYGGFRGLLLGSVSHQCASHAECPVVVVPAHVDVSDDD
ncbi:MAG: universal stress protein [Acidimicrobiales bacterium]